MGGNVSIYTHSSIRAPSLFWGVNRQTQPNPLRNGVDCHTCRISSVSCFRCFRARVSGFYLDLDLDFTIPSIPSVE
jgi:hypothetical protein